MESIPLSDFIKSTLVEVAEGVSQANEEIESRYKEKGKGRDSPNDPMFQISRSTKTSGYPSKPLEFDIAITANRLQERKFGLGVLVGAIGSGANTTDQKDNKIDHRIRFSVEFGDRLY